MYMHLGKCELSTRHKLELHKMMDLLTLLKFCNQVRQGLRLRVPRKHGTISNVQRSAAALDELLQLRQVILKQRYSIGAAMISPKVCLRTSGSSHKSLHSVAQTLGLIPLAQSNA